MWNPRPNHGRRPMGAPYGGGFNGPRDGGVVKQRTYRKKSTKPSRDFTKQVGKALDELAENKSTDSSVTASPFGTSGTLSYITLPTQGSTENQRIGQKIKARSLRLRGYIQADTTINLSQVRMIIGCWKDFQGTSPTASLLMDTPGAVVPSFYNRDTLVQRKWVPMYDKVWNLDGATASNVIPTDSIVNFEISFSGKKLPLKELTFNNAGVVQNQYFIFCYSNWTAGGTAPRLTYDARITFTDV